LGHGRAEDPASVREAGFDLHLVMAIDLEQVAYPVAPPNISSR